MTVWTGLAGLWFLFLGLKQVFFCRSIRLLKYEKFSDTVTWPTVSLIVPACNEAETVGPALQSLLQLDYPGLELVVVDDRSSDNTSTVVKSLGDPRIQLIRIDSLPDGWLGKVHALHVGARAAHGEWLLFSDADVHHQKTSLKKAISFCLRERADFLSVAPAIICKSLPLRMMVIQFLQTLAIAYSKRLADPNKQDAVGAGAFNLVHRQALASAGGFTELRMEVLDDAGLAWLIKRSGGKLGLLAGLDEIELEWYPSLWAFVHGLEKNAFALMQYSLATVGIYGLGVWSIYAASMMPLFCGQIDIVKLLYIICFAFYLLASAVTIKRVFGEPPWLAMTLPISFPLFPLVFLRSAFYCLKRGGIIWRGTHYSLNELRERQRIRLLELIFGKRG